MYFEISYSIEQLLVNDGIKYTYKEYKNLDDYINRLKSSYGGQTEKYIKKLSKKNIGTQKKEIKRIKENNKEKVYLKQECDKYNFTFIDTSNNFEYVINNISL